MQSYLTKIIVSCTWPSVTSEKIISSVITMSALFSNSFFVNLLSIRGAVLVMLGILVDDSIIIRINIIIG